MARTKWLCPVDGKRAFESVQDGHLYDPGPTAARGVPHREESTHDPTLGIR